MFKDYFLQKNDIVFGLILVGDTDWSGSEIEILSACLVRANCRADVNIVAVRCFVCRAAVTRENNRNNNS